ncbi:Nucleoside diphosphate kinase A [Portunus trituberculatus]|uniref:nucleoside-diphosphate kinase n=1 Tax=Portunus trituberculatus TaxID=210409 RepID=A0A5B7CE11_PORTR|nr:Nucleoside diphosphate kinase A [Portunus trituberculatus]
MKTAEWAWYAVGAAHHVSSSARRCSPASLWRPMLVSLAALLSFLAPRLTPLAIMVRERTFIAVKPDGVQRGLTGEIIKRFEAKGFKLVGMKFMQASVGHPSLIFG